MKPTWLMPTLILVGCAAPATLVPQTAPPAQAPATEAAPDQGVTINLGSLENLRTSTASAPANPEWVWAPEASPSTGLENQPSRKEFQGWTNG